MYYHKMYGETKLLVNANQAVLLTGEKGTGKTTLFEQLAKDLELNFYVTSMTNQTTLSSLVGYKNVNGDYVRTLLRECVEFGGLMLLDEIDAGNPNVLLSLNTLENGFLSFPDGIVRCHKNFRLVATANPQSKHYTGRAKLDAATLDRFDIIQLEIDPDLEKNIMGNFSYDVINDIRITLKEWNFEKYISMRDGLRLQLRKTLNLHKNYAETLLDKDPNLIAHYNNLRIKKDFLDQSECKTTIELYNNVKKEAGVFE